MSAKHLVLNDAIAGYIDAIAGREAPILARLREETASHPHAMMQITPLQGQFMQLLLQASGARRVLEIGVFTGYSSLAMALALPDDGRIVALDVSEEYTAIARRYWSEAGVAGRIDLRLAPAVDSLDAMLAAGEADSFDAAFIDADKENYPAYWEKSLDLVRPGGLIMIDNTLFSGLVTPEWSDAKLRQRWDDAGRSAAQQDSMLQMVKSIRAFNEALHHDRRVSLSLLPIGDGLTLAVKR